MSSNVVYSCATCSKTVEGRQHYAICVLCSRRVHRKCNGDRFNNSSWTTIRQNFTCTACEAGSRGQHFNSCSDSDGERRLVIGESMDKTHDASTYVPSTTIEYDIIIGASQMGGEIVSDGCGYTYGMDRDYPSFRVWRCTFRGCVKFPRCKSTFKQLKRPGVDFFVLIHKETLL